MSPESDGGASAKDTCARGQHEYVFSTSCGANVCQDCGDHNGLERCYCGWSLSGGDGRQELIEMGETIDPDEW